MPILLMSYHYNNFILLQVRRESKVSRIMTAHSYAWMFVNMLQRQILHNIIPNICKFILNFCLTNSDSMAQWELQYPIIIFGIVSYLLVLVP